MLRGIYSRVAPLKDSLLSSRRSNLPAFRFDTLVACAEDGTLWQKGSGMRHHEIIEIPHSQLYYVAVSYGSDHIVALNAFGIAYGFGSNCNGQLGFRTGRYPWVKKPRRIRVLRDITMVSCGSEFTLFLDRDHRAWSCGTNSEGQLGLGDKIERYVPTLIPDLEDIQSISAGFAHSLVLDSHGQVYSFDSNGQLGVKLNETLNQDSPELVTELNDCIHIMCGGFFSVVHLSDRRVQVFGDNKHQQLGFQGEQPEQVDEPTENPDLFGKILVPGMHHMLIGDLDDNRGFAICGFHFKKRLAPTSGIKLEIPSYLGKNYGETKIHG